MSACAADIQRAMHPTPEQLKHEQAADRFCTVAKHYGDNLLRAVASGADTALRHPINTDKHYPVSEYLAECGPEARALLLKACHLSKTGKFEAGTKAMLEFVDRVAFDYGTDMAIEFAGDEP